MYLSHFKCKNIWGFHATRTDLMRFDQSKQYELKFLCPHWSNFNFQSSISRYLLMLTLDSAHFQRQKNKSRSILTLDIYHVTYFDAKNEHRALM